MPSRNVLWLLTCESSITSENADADWEEELGIEYVDMEHLLQTSDYVTLHVPLTQETTHMIGKAELELMKSTAILVNIARALLLTTMPLRSTHRRAIAGAALDVTEPEPLNTDHPLLGLDNLIVALILAVLRSKHG